MKNKYSAGSGSPRFLGFGREQKGTFAESYFTGVVACVRKTVHLGY